MLKAVTQVISSRCSRQSPTSFQADAQGSHPRHFKLMLKAVTHVISSRRSRQSPTSFQADAQGSHPRHLVPLPSNCRASSRTLLPVVSILSPFTKAASDLGTTGPRSDLASFWTRAPLAGFLPSLLPPSDARDLPGDTSELIWSDVEELDSRTPLRTAADTQCLAVGEGARPLCTRPSGVRVCPDS